MIAPTNKSDWITWADLNRFNEKFGAEKALRYLMEGVSFEDALRIEFDALKAKQREPMPEGRSNPYSEV